jgi:restriction endonuclease Mrr
LVADRYCAREYAIGSKDSQLVTTSFSVVAVRNGPTGSVGRPEVQAFYGALAGQRANKGVFITTSTFSQQAIGFARSVERVVLVDGERLAGLMMEHEVGVTLRPLKVANPYQPGWRQ